MIRYPSGAPNPKFPYKISFPDGFGPLAKEKAMEDWLDDYPHPSRYFIDYRWTAQDESWEIHFEDEQIAMLFALKWQGQ